MNNTINRLKKRRAGILLHPTSLPGPVNGGDLGPNAYWFVDFLARSGITVWQMLPLGPPHDDLSPYQCQSVHAGNTRLISLELLVQAGWLHADELRINVLENHSADCRCRLLQVAFNRFKRGAAEEVLQAYGDFLTRNSAWLDDYVLFCALKEVHGHAAWWDWELKYQQRNPLAIATARQHFAVEIVQYAFEQFLFFWQWTALKKYANERGVLLFGDMPIFVAADSVDVWADRENFLVDARGQPNVVAGVPPDYFSATGQRWGNPHYAWEYMETNGFRWWRERLHSHQVLFDLIRIDHFRGFEAYWEIPASAPTAMEGRWVKAPGEALFDTLHRKPMIPLVAEDLGVITPEVTALRKKYQIPGMKILQFAFEGGGASNPYLPHHHAKNSVVYTGTHDNNTSLGWFKSMSPAVQQYVCDYLGARAEDMPWPLIQAAFASVARLAIVPMQDVLACDAEHRMNTPGVPQGNWRWRFEWSQVPKDLDQRLHHLVSIYGRL